MQRLFVGPWSATLISDGDEPVPFVTASTALRLTPVYRAVTLIASDVARVELECTSPAANSLLENPYRFMSAFELRRSMTLQVLLYGNAFAAINKTLGGELLELILLEPGSVSLDLTRNEPIYRTRAYGELTRDQVFHLRAPSANGLWGESPIDLCATSLRLLAAHEDMSLKAYQNGGNPKIALVHPGKLSLEVMQKMEAQFAKTHGGSANAGRPLVLSEGMKVERISSTIDDQGLEQARRYSVGDVSRIFGVPSSYLSETVGSSYGTMEWLSRMYVQACLEQWFAVWRSEILSKLCGPGERVYFDTDDLARPGLAETMAALRTGVEAGIITRNEAREEIDREPLPGLDAPIVALNMGTGGGATNIGSDTSEEAGSNDDFSS
jgi:HK97 family phage portal protein